VKVEFKKNKAKGTKGVKEIATLKKKKEKGGERKGGNTRKEFTGLE